MRLASMDMESSDSLRVLVQASTLYRSIRWWKELYSLKVSQHVSWLGVMSDVTLDWSHDELLSIFLSLSCSMDIISVCMCESIISLYHLSDSQPGIPTP